MHASCKKNLICRLGMHSLIGKTNIRVGLNSCGRTLSCLMKFTAVFFKTAISPCSAELKIVNISSHKHLKLPAMSMATIFMLLCAQIHQAHPW